MLIAKVAEKHKWGVGHKTLAHVLVQVFAFQASEDDLRKSVIQEGRRTSGSIATDIQSMSRNSVSRRYAGSSNRVRQLTASPVSTRWP